MMEKLDLGRSNLRKFGIIMGVAFIAISGIIFLKHRHFPLWGLISSGLFFIAAFTFPLALKPIYITWMKLAFVLAWVNTRLILTIIFYLVFTPIGLILKLFKVDLLEKKMDKKASTYWKSKEEVKFDPSLYERQF
ncbi:MAG: SxtJ family membrane protein [Candidatus Omnitrophica bacterium]|nr:SxtJ family membrane protein [Candidatus Omnitrophota bacterium]